MFNPYTLKYKNRKPRDKEEHIEAIYEELSENEILEKRDITLKTYVYQIRELLRNFEKERELKNYGQEMLLTSTMLWLALIALVLLWNGCTTRDSDWPAWLSLNSLSAKMWGVALATLYIGVTIEKHSLFSNIWQFSFTKFMASLVVSGLVVFSSGKASQAINLVFGVDASIFPYTRTFVTALFVFHYLLPFLVLLGLVASIVAIDAIGFIKSLNNQESAYKSPPWNSFVFPLLSFILIGICWEWSKNDINDAKLPVKIYKLAHELDFNANHPCTNIKEKMPVVFIGASHAIVLADQSEGIGLLNVLPESEIDVPRSFLRLECKIIDDPNKSQFNSTN